jgi:hypothetical protein
MSGVERDKSRVKATAEVFTPDGLVQEILDKLFHLSPEIFEDPSKTVLDPSCGDGQFLVWVVLYKLIQGNYDLLGDDEIMQMDVTEEFKQALSTVYGVDLMEDNVVLALNAFSIRVFVAVGATSNTYTEDSDDTVAFSVMCGCFKMLCKSVVIMS